MLSTNQKGAIAATAITHAAVKLGTAVYRPVAEGGRFDVIFAFPDASVSRVQCKWEPVVKGTVAIRSYSARRAREGMRYRSYTAKEIDAVAAYCPGNGRCYYIPVARVDGRRVVHLRLEPARNNQVDGVNYAVEYELGAIAQLGERVAGSHEVGGSSPPGSTGKAA
jgi:hypothetical protein